MLFFIILIEFYFFQEGGDFIFKDEKGNVLFFDVDFVDIWQVLYMYLLINYCVLEYCKIYFDICILFIDIGKYFMIFLFGFR